MTSATLDTRVYSQATKYLLDDAPVPGPDGDRGAALAEVLTHLRGLGIPRDEAADMVKTVQSSRGSRWKAEDIETAAMFAYRNVAAVPVQDPDAAAIKIADEWAGPLTGGARRAELQRYIKHLATTLPLNIRDLLEHAENFNRINCPDEPLDRDEIAEAVEHGYDVAVLGRPDKPAALAPATAEAPTVRPLIVQTPHDLPKNVQQAEDALLADISGGRVMAHADDYVIVCPARPVSAREKIRGGTGARIQRLGVAALRERLAKAATFQTIASNGKRLTSHPAPELLAALDAKHGGNAPALTGIANHPVPLPDGRIIATPGYDEETGIYLVCGDGQFPAVKSWRIVPAPSQPGQGMSDLDRVVAGIFHGDNYVAAKGAAQQACKAITAGALQGFCFRDRVDESAAIAAIMTGLVKPTIGITPGFAISSPTQGSGKTALAIVISIVVEGGMPGMQDWSDNEAENEKTLLSMNLAGQRVGVLDNVPDGRELNSSKMARNITAEVVQGRVLGESRIVRAPNVMLPIVSGNNLACAGDLASRMLEIYIDSRLERPDQRAFQRDPAEWAQQHRPEIVHQALTIMKAYLDAGAPAVDAKPTRFPMWDRMVRNPIIWAGGADIGVKFDAAYAADTMLAALRQVLTGWVAVLGDKPISASTIVDKVSILNNGAGVEAFRQALHHLVGDKRSTVLDPRTVGTRLKRYLGRPVDDLRLASHYDSHKKINLFMVDSVPVAEVLS